MDFEIAKSFFVMPIYLKRRRRKIYWCRL